MNTVQKNNNIISCNFILYCKRWSQTVDFYNNKLDLPINFQNDWFVEFIIDDSSRLSIADENRASVKSCRGTGITISLKTEDINVLIKQLETNKLNIPPIKKHPWGALCFFIYDPEGNRIEFWQPVKK